MRTIRVVVPEVATENSNQMYFVQHDDVIKTFTSDRAYDAFCVSVLPRGAWCSLYFLNSQIGNPRANDISVYAVTFSDKESWCFVEGKGLGKLLRSP